MSALVVGLDIEKLLKKLQENDEIEEKHRLLYFLLNSLSFGGVLFDAEEDDLTVTDQSEQVDEELEIEQERKGKKEVVEELSSGGEQGDIEEEVVGLSEEFLSGVLLVERPRLHQEEEEGPREDCGENVLEKEESIFSQKPGYHYILN